MSKSAPKTVLKYFTADDATNTMVKLLPLILKKKLPGKLNYVGIGHYGCIFTRNKHHFYNPYWGVSRTFPALLKSLWDGKKVVISFFAIHLLISLSITIGPLYSEYTVYLTD